MQNFEFSEAERDLIAAAPVEKVKLSTNFLNKNIRWSPSKHEIQKKEDVVKVVLEGMAKGYVRLFEEKFSKEKIFSGAYPERFDEKNRPKGEYLADYQNGLLIDCRFTGNHNEICEVFKVYEFTNVTPPVKQYQETPEILKREDDPGVVYKTQKNG